ncbi:hypothetical protein GKZ89_20180 [Bacillus mangrovi]|uniref:Metallo-beta-lactamase domain-containing protein n=1 Tax=Metabacillus mangrovi TaxID=1491830 RepID=A0A7X2S9D9_9BACI|nr:hypothetical protein [Metabacillus mangrovi]MTH55717.1 hypothetical protein [Metabacillus mangrovi]
MSYVICETCGVQYAQIETPSECIICSEERQYVSPSGQTWTSLEEMKKLGIYKNEILAEEAGLYSVTTKPGFGIGQTAYLIQEQRFNVLWDCNTYIDEETIQDIKNLGGVQAIALSHPHYYSAQVEWAEAFDAPIYIHEDDKEWVMRSSDKIIFWAGESLELHQGIVLHRLGGHFKGGAVLEWKNGDREKGILLTGDVIQVVADRKWVSFMYSYPNLIPLPAAKVEQIAEKVKPVKFNRLYNAFHRIVQENADEAVQRSAERYVKAVNGTLFDT